MSADIATAHYEENGTAAKTAAKVFREKADAVWFPIKLAIGSVGPSSCASIHDHDTVEHRMRALQSSLELEAQKEFELDLADSITP